ncbi:MAG: hypothetical protein JNM69_18475 [Archangium sp.]|nr:hypothetical protein [Archangium sp.]
MNTVKLAALGFLVGAAVAVAPSCGGGACNAMNCANGCCDSTGKCQAGTTPAACGKGGVTCGACAPGQACTLQICGGPMGTGGGSANTGGGFASAGGSAGGTADAGLNCMDYGEIDLMEDVEGSFNIGDPDGGLAGFEWWDAFQALEAPANRVDTFTAELYFETANGPPTFPYAGNLPLDTDFGSCDSCFSASLGCDDNLDNCEGDYLATSGSYNFTAGTRRTDAGVFVGEGRNLIFRRWNFASDRPSGTACFTVSKLTFRGVWPDAPVDAGLVDAGVVDAGSRDGG